MIQNLLVPLDGTDFGEHALPWALSIARRTEAVIHLVHVDVPPILIYGEDLPDTTEACLEAIEAQSKDYLDEIQERAQCRSSSPVETYYIRGEACKEIGRYADQVSADYIIMSSHGRGGLSRLLFGSVADELIRQVQAPMLLIRQGEGVPDLDLDPYPEHVLVPLDGTERSEQILRHIIPLSRIWLVKLTLMNVIGRARPGTGHPRAGTSSPEERGDASESSYKISVQKRVVQRYFQEISTRLVREGIQPRLLHCVDDDPASTILKITEDIQADMIAMESQCLSGLNRLLLGSVADQVVRKASRPVLLHRVSNSE